MMTRGLTSVRAFTVAALIAVAGVARGCAAMQPETHDAQLGKPDVVAEDATRDLKHTRVTPTLDAPIEAGVSLVWCSTFQLAWNELGPLMGAPLKVTGSAEAQELAAQLNRAKESKADLDEASYVALAGGAEVLEHIKAELMEKFGGAASPRLLPEELEPGALFAYAYLFKSLKFATPFIRREGGLAFGDARVAAFGVWNGVRNDDAGKMMEQVAVLSYGSEREFAVELKTTSGGDRLIIARVAPGKTFGATVQNVMKAMEPAAGERAPAFRWDDTLVVPVMNFDVLREVRELLGASVAGTRAAGQITSAKQSIRFRLDEKGAILKSEAAIGITSASPDRPKRMVCDGAFAVLLMRRGAAAPYFAMWVDSPELLTKFE